MFRGPSICNLQFAICNLQFAICIFSPLRWPVSWRKWLVRFLVFSSAGGLALAVLLYERWTDPAVVREQVIEQLRVHFPGATISVDSAYIHLLGGIAVAELRMA